MNKPQKIIKDILARDRFVEAHSGSVNFNTKLYMQILASLAFLVLSIANVFSRSYYMLLFTLAGCVTNGISALYARKTGNGRICAISSIVTCSLLFGFFVIYGGNDGFACLWITLLPFLSMIVMDFVIGFCASAFFQTFLIIVFWTPIREMLFYQYNAQFCLRFPLFFFVTFVLGLALTISLRKSQYNECQQLLKLEEITETAHKLARLDSLTELANRRFAYEEFKTNYSDENCTHCIIMGDIDNFKRINDTYGHEFGDDVLVIFAKYIKEQLPQDYLKSRWGGEEFLFAANESLDAVYEKIENLRNIISKHEFNVNGTPVHVTVTFGIAEYTGSNDISEAISKADSRLYSGKKAQKNCTVTDG